MSVASSSNVVQISTKIAEAVGANSQQVIAAIELLDGGATVPFISRYRKEATGGLSDSQLRLLDEKLGYLRELDDRKSAIQGTNSDRSWIRTVGTNAMDSSGKRPDG